MKKVKGEDDKNIVFNLMEYFKTWQFFPIG